MTVSSTKHRRACRRGWFPLIGLSLSVIAFRIAAELPFADRFRGFDDFAAMPAWWVAWGLVFAFFGAMKWLTWRRTPAPRASAGRQLGYLFAWPGLDAPTFLCGPAPSGSGPLGYDPGDQREAVLAIGKVVFGAALFWGAARMVPSDWPIFQGWVGLCGLAIGLLGGVFHWLSWLWCAYGVDAPPVMNAPLRSRSIAEFWSRRWNTAFHDFVRRFIHRPLAERFGPATATTAVFLASGLLHDAVLSVPAEAGYGRPTLYFLLQLAGLAVERSPLGKQSALGRGFRGRIFAIVVIVGPVGLLFHRPFIERVWLPFLHAAGAI